MFTDRKLNGSIYSSHYWKVAVAEQNHRCLFPLDILPGLKRRGFPDQAAIRNLTSCFTEQPDCAASPQANRESPSLKMFFAALVSAFSV